LVIKSGVGEDAGDVFDGALVEGVVQETMDAVPQGKGRLQDGGSELPAVSETGSDGEDFIATGG
jgi:hypothetical protein